MMKLLKAVAEILDRFAANVADPECLESGEFYLQMINDHATMF